MQMLSTIWNAINPVVAAVADFAGIIGLVISCVTLRNTKNIQKALISHAEKVEFEQNISKIVTELNSLSDSIHKDDLYTQEILDNILDKIDSLEIYYPTAVAKVKKDITSLKKMTNQAIGKITSQPNHNKRQIAHGLSVLAKKLDKLVKEVKAQ